MKKRLTQAEEFELLKMVLDKFLWLGFDIMVYGLWIMATAAVDAISRGLTFVFAGAVVLVLFLVLLVKEYEVVR